jgi:diguanylate cyclase (GGDEF)-like protein
MAEPRTGDSALSLSLAPPRGARMPLYSVVVAGSAATFATLLAAAGRVWMLPLAGALVYLTIKSYRIYRGQLADERRHAEDMARLHREAMTALEAARQSEQRYARAARHDDLTGLPNRRLFSELLQRSIARAARAVEPRYAVLFVDLDGFKLVNDSLGHLVGDQFLVAISSRLQTQLRPSDVLSRLGGDEFAVLIEGFATQDEVCVVTERLQRSLRDPIRLHERELFASASIGVVLGGPHYEMVEDLLRDADIAMYRAKAAGRGGYQIFDPYMHATAVERLTLETELRHAVERHDFTLFYQPIVVLPSS